MHTIHTVANSLTVQLTGDEEANSNTACQPPGSLQHACRCGCCMLRISMKRISFLHSDAGKKRSIYEWHHAGSRACMGSVKADLQTSLPLHRHSRPAAACHVHVCPSALLQWHALERTYAHHGQPNVHPALESQPALHQYGGCCQHSWLRPDRLHRVERKKEYAMSVG